MYLGRAPRTKETLPDFLKWRRVNRPPLVFRRLTGSQRTPGFWGVTFALFCIQLWSWERLHVGRPDFGRPHADLPPPPAQAMHDADVDVGDGDLPEPVHHGLPGHPPAEPEVQLPLPLGCRWRVPLTRVHNPSGVLLLYRDQLDAQTPDQVLYCETLWFYINYILFCKIY